MKQKALSRCGRIALLGAPNAGKSTLMNRLVGAKVAIVTPKAQTTRFQVLGVMMEGDAQLIFLDAPGIFPAKAKFEQSMVASAWRAAFTADVIIYLHDARKLPNEETEAAIKRLRTADKPVLLCLNKIDAVKDKKTLLARADWFHEHLTPTEIFMISGKKGDGLVALREALAARLPEGPHLYPYDALTDLPMRLIACELTREQCFLKLQQELPYALTVESERYETRADGSVTIHQNILVENERQKTILIGKGGIMLKAIGAKARGEIAKLLGAPCHLYLFVKIRPDWKQSPDAYQYPGLQG